MPHRTQRVWQLADLGRVPYPEARELQLRLVEARIAGTWPSDILIMLEHPPVFTLGRRGGRENLKVAETELARRGISIIQVERGGNITYHGPGQAVLYPIVKLEATGIRVVDMVDGLEEVMIRTCAHWGIEAQRNRLNRGAWVGRKKIGAIGLAVRRGVSFHGMALNVATDLTPFGWIDPCGLSGVGVTSIRVESRQSVEIADVAPVLQKKVAEVFQSRLEAIPESALHTLREMSKGSPAASAGGLPAASMAELS
jgi:lipoyl(octanoyl) transferase